MPMGWGGGWEWVGGGSGRGHGSATEVHIQVTAQLQRRQRPALHALRLTGSNCVPGASACPGRSAPAAARLTAMPLLVS
jgi:hypothetical protein